MSKIIKFVCIIIFELSELIGVSLGRVAPYIFGGMIERFPRKIKETQNDDRWDTTRILC